MFRNPFWQRLAIVFLLIAILLLGIMAAAAATADRFYVSRIIAWKTGADLPQPARTSRTELGNGKVNLW